VRVRAVDQPNVERERGAVDEVAEERSDEVGRHPAQPGPRQVDVGHEQRRVARLERDMSERLGRWDDRGAVAARAFGAKRRGERLAERAARGAHLRVGIAGSDLEGEVEGCVLGQKPQEVIEDRDARDDVRVAASFDRHAHLRARSLRFGRHERERTGAPYCSKRWAERPMPPGKARSSVTTGMRARFMALAAGAVLAIVAVPPAPAAELGPAGTSARAWPRAEATIGYSTPDGLRSALALYPAQIVHRVPALRVADVRPLGSLDGFAANVSRLPGIRFVQRLALRDEYVEPALELAAGRSVPWEWQYSVSREDAVPVDVLRAASAITIAVIDTGADLNAPDLAAKAPITYNQRTGTGDVHDTVGHGTFVSALAAGSVTNGDGIAGFGGDAQLMVIKAGSGDGSFTDLDEASAIVYAVDHGARIINLSLGGPSTSNTEKKAIDYAASHGTLIVAAAGNEFQDGNPAEYPAALLQPLGSRGVGGRGLAVGASTMSGSRAIFSNTGSYLSLVAPGDNVFSAVSSLSTPSRFPRVPLPGSLSGLYGYASGTSFAAPEVAGAAALVWAANPLLDADRVAEILKETASSSGVWTSDLGWGVLDVAAAVSRASGAQPMTATAFLSLSGLLRARTAMFTATLRSAAPGVAPSTRIVALEVYDGVRWQTKGQSATSASGDAAWKLTLKPGRYRVRARWAGAGDLAGAVSKTLALRVL